MPHHEIPLPRLEPPLPRGGAPAGAHGSPDAELAAILPGITGPSGQFRHLQHINLAFLAVRRYGMPEATARICDWIQRIAAYERAPQKYHHTVSRAWVEIVAHHVGENPGCTDFDTLPRVTPRCWTSACSAGTTGRRPWPPGRPGEAGSSPTCCPSPGQHRAAGPADRSPRTYQLAGARARWR